MGLAPYSPSFFTATTTVNSAWSISKGFCCSSDALGRYRSHWMVCYDLPFSWRRSSSRPSGPISLSCAAAHRPGSPGRFFYRRRRFPGNTVLYHRVTPWVTGLVSYPVC